MSQSSTSSESRLIADLNDLLQLDHDAVEAYTIAIDLVRSTRFRDSLVEYRADHKRHIEEIAALVRARGGLPTELPHATAPLKLTVQALGAAPGDVTLLLAFKAVEGQARDKYQRYATRTWPADVADVVKAAAADEQRHYQWVEQSLRELGVGAGTIPHGIASAVEGLHKLLADPIEGIERKVKEHVGNLVGTSRRRDGASEAPSPADAASSMSDRMGDRMNDMADSMREQARAAGDAMRGAMNNVVGEVMGRGGRGPGATPAGATSTGPSAEATAFIAALRALEESGDVESMVALYTEDAETSGPTDRVPHQGREGARAFWRMYRDSFEEITSSFTNVVVGPDGTVMLEWTSEGRALTGGRVGYAGVSVVEMRDGRVRRFRTYFDTRDLELPAREATSSTSSSRPSSQAGTWNDVPSGTDTAPDAGTVPGAGI
jgi:ketosteroid isomerase-like protein